VVRIDNGLVRIPWELLFDGERFFCIRWNMGRLVRTPQRLYGTSPRRLALPLRMTVIADPRGDLPAAYREGCLIRDMLDPQIRKVQTELLSHQVDTAAVLERLKECDILHYAGHADHVSEDPATSGWLMRDGKVTATQVMGIQGGVSGPSLVFVNACLSGQTGEWTSPSQESSQEIYGLANAFLLAGARHYVGTFWEIPDEPGSAFAMRFYRELASGTPVGGAVRAAREEIVRVYGESAVVWATYMLYGDPTVVYVAEEDRPASEALHGEPPPAVTRPCGEEMRVRGGAAEIPASPGLLPDPSPASARRRPRHRARILLGTLAVLLAVAAAGVLLHRGGVKERSGIDRLLQETGEEIYARGDTPALVALYEDALASREATPVQLGKLRGRVGRFYARQGEMEKALEHYREALALNPGDRVVRSDRCQALSRLGRFEEARDCVEGLLASDPRDEIALALNRTLEERLALETDRDRRERTDALMSRLSGRATAGEGAPQAPQTPEDLWTSRPLTLVLLDLEEQGGLSRRDGETETFVLMILDRLQQSPRIRVVDRALLERAMEELDLGTGGLSDPLVSLRLGRILSARLLGHGSLYRDGNSVQVNLKFIETETTALRVALSRTFPRSTPLDTMAGEIASGILDKIEQRYPLRGEVVSVQGRDDVRVNLGRGVGLRQGALLDVLRPGQTDPGMVLTRLRVLSVGEDDSLARILEHPQIVRPGCRVLEAPAPKTDQPDG